MTDEPAPDRDPDRDPDRESPQPGIKPGGAKRRRTASMKVSRPKPPAAPAAAPDTRPPQRHRLLDSDHVQRFRDFLDTRPGRVTLIGTAVVAALLGPLAVYSLFAVAYVFRRPLRRAVARAPLGPRTTLGILIVLAGLLRHTSAWIAEYVQGDERTALLHPQLLPGLLIAFGLYTAWALGWGIALLWYRYRLSEVLLIQAAFGIVIEDLGLYLFAGFAALPMGVFIWLYAAAISASTLGLAWVLAGDKLAALPERDRGGAFRYTAPPLLIGASLVAIFTLWGRLLNEMGMLTDPAPIRQRPFR